MLEKKLNVLKSKWHELNPKFDIQVVDSQALEKLIPASLKNLSLEKRLLIARFYLLKENGGVYVDTDFLPANLEEFNYKYGYYGKINKMNKLSDKLSLDTKVMAFAPGHSILQNLLLHLENYLLKAKNIEEADIKNLYLEYVYKYYALNGDSIVFPDMYFDQKR